MITENTIQEFNEISQNSTDLQNIDKSKCSELISRTKYSEYIDIVKIKTENGNKNFLALGINAVSKFYSDEEAHKLELITPNLLDIIVGIAVTVNEIENKKF